MPSLTLPDQAMTIQTIMQRFVRGQSIPKTIGEPVYDDIEQLAELRNLDNFEKMDLVDQISEDIQNQQNPPPLEEVEKPLSGPPDESNEKTEP